MNQGSPVRGVSSEMVALRLSHELKDGQYVNVGSGMATQVQKWLSDKPHLIIHSEVGVLGCGRFAEEDEYDNELINAGGEPITLIPGGCFMDAVDAFGIMRGGHLDISIMGAFQVSEAGDLANWHFPGKDSVLPGVGGAMDVALGAKRVLIIMKHTEQDGTPKIVKTCTYPVTAYAVVTDMFTDLAVIKVTADGLVLLEVAPGVTPETVQARTDAKLIISADLHEMEF